MERKRLRWLAISRLKVWSVLSFQYRILALDVETLDDIWHTLTSQNTFWWKNNFPIKIKRRISPKSSKEKPKDCPNLLAVITRLVSEVSNISSYRNSISIAHQNARCCTCIIISDSPSICGIMVLRLNKRTYLHCYIYMAPLKGASL